MNKGMKTLAKLGLSTLLVTSAAFPSVGLATTEYPSNQVSAATVELQKKYGKQKENQSPISENSFVVKYSKPLTAKEHKAAGGTLIKQISTLKYAEIKVANKKNLAKVMKAYQKLGKVESVSPSYLGTMSNLVDPKASQQYQHSLLKISEAQKLVGKNSVTVAVIDTGTDSKHPDLKKVLLPGYNAANPANQPITQDHGTHVSGIIGAEKNNGIGGHGISSNVKILPIDVFDGTSGATDASVAEGIIYAADNGAKVINMSLGFMMPVPLVKEAVQYAIDKGVIVIAAAGNDASDYVSYPAGFEGVISVGSINSKKELSYFSTYGPSVDVVAPGEDVYSTMYDYSKKSTFANGSGTSMASPVVAGVAALLLSKHPNLTPAQVEYVLEQTADDLGETGFDTKYANGLVNPVKALSYDVKSIPSTVKESWTEDEILTKAEEVDSVEKIVKEGNITKPYEQKWIKFDVKKGDYIQAVLEGTKQFDYKLMVHFFKDGKVVESFDINDTQDGTVEGKLVTAPEDGTVAIGVKDVNGSYNASSAYTLSVEKTTQLPEDESSVDNMVAIGSLPYELPQAFTLVGEETDNDYFTLKVSQDQLVKLNMSGIPGLNTQISVFNTSNYFSEDDAMSDEMKKEMLVEILEGEGAYGDFVGNKNGIGQGESLTFPAEANQEYIVKVSGAGYQDDFGILQILSMLLGLPFEDVEDTNNYSSLVPYTFSATGKALPEDEDGLNDNLFGYEEEYFSEIILFSAANEEQDESDEVVNEEEQNDSEEVVNEEEQNESDEVVNEEEQTESDEVTNEEEETTEVDSEISEHQQYLNDMVTTILEQGRSYSIGQEATGYIQNGNDLDYFVLEPSETAVYAFNVANKDGNIPLVSVQEVSEEVDEKDSTKVNYNYNTIAENVDWSTWNYDELVTDVAYASMEKGKKYLIQVANNTYTSMDSLSFEPYQITSEKVVSNPQDRFEPSSFENLNNLPSTTFQANLGQAYDSDVFYYQSTKDEIKAISIATGKAPTSMTNYPKEVISEYKGLAVVIEDSNGNRELDEEDNVISYLEKGTMDFTSGSFKVKKGKGYFIEVSGYMVDGTAFSLLPYTFKMQSMDRKDEVSSQSKPIKLKTLKGTMFASGYLNAGIAGGDEDWYEFELAKNSSGIIRLEAGKEADGVIEIYQNGKLIKTLDSYGIGDNEDFRISLNKGKYQVKVSDAYGVASISPYTLKVNMK